MYKYKAESVAELIERRKRLEEQLKHIEGGSEAMEELEKRLQETEERMRHLCGELHRTREEGRERLCGELKRLTMELGIRHAEFAVELAPSGQFTPTGCDEVRFVFRQYEPAAWRDFAGGFGG